MPMVTAHSVALREAEERAAATRREAEKAAADLEAIRSWGDQRKEQLHFPAQTNADITGMEYVCQCGWKTVRGDAVSVMRNFLNHVDAYTMNDGHTMDDLAINTFARICIERLDEWHPHWRDPNHQTYWLGSDWSNALAGEVGEACNIVKKIRRAETSTSGSQDADWDGLIAALADELGDVMAYLVILAKFYGIDLALSAAKKFNAVSVREGYAHRVWVPEEHR